MSVSALHTANERQATPAWAMASLVIVIAFLASVSLPLATYTSALALFGLAHVAFEMRYVGWRFGDRLRGPIFAAMAMTIAIAVAGRALSTLGFIPRAPGTAIELAAGAILAIIPVLAMRRRRLAGLSVALPFALGAVIAPIETLLVLAVLHNLTPLAFLADIVEPSRRWRALAIGFSLLVIAPLFIASGVPGDLMERFSLVAPEASLFAAGRLDDNIGAFVPEFLDTHPLVIDMFAAAVFAQCMHYLATIWLLPRIMRERTQTTQPRTRAGLVYGASVVAASLALVSLYSIDYGAARKIYALIALVHAWLEIPVLILALDRSASGSIKT